MICPNCGAENAQGAPYCYNCANPLPQTGAMPPGSVPPGSVPPGSVPPGPGQTAQFPQTGPVPPASMPPGSVPPGGTPPPQWPTGGGYEPPKPPKSTISAGVGGLIAFLVVAGIGAILFFTVFNKKDKAEPVPPPPPTPSVSVPASSGPGPTTAPTTAATTGATTAPTTGATTAATTGATTGATTAATTAPTTGPTTGVVSGPTGPKGGGKPSFEPFFCRKAPTSNTFGNGCARHLTVSPTTVNFAFVIRTQNIPAGVGFAVTFFDDGNQAVGSFDMPKTTADRINRLILSITLNQIAAGQEFVAVITADGQATTCAGHVCSRNELASISFG